MAFYHALNLIGELYDNAEVYFKEHASDLCEPGTKHGETKLAFFGVKIGMPTVIKTISDSLKSVAARWFADEAMKRFVVLRLYDEIPTVARHVAEVHRRYVADRLGTVFDESVGGVAEIAVDVHGGNGGGAVEDGICTGRPVVGPYRR